MVKKPLEVRSPTIFAPIGYPDMKATAKGYTLRGSFSGFPTLLIKSAKIKKGSKIGTIELAQMTIAVFEPDSVTAGNTTIAAAKHAAAVIISLFSKFFAFILKCMLRGLF